MAEIFNQREENSIVDRALTPLPQPHLTGMKLQGDIALGEFLFNTIDEYGVVWVITEIDGWWQHPEPDMPDIPRGYGDGSYDIKGRYQARVINLVGSFLTPNPDLVEAARDRLIEATNLVYRGAWLKTGLESTNKRSSFVRLSGGPQIQTTTARGRTDFSIGLKAADPIKYEWNDSQPEGFSIVEIPAFNRTTLTTGVDTINNIGNVAVPIQLEISGPITGPARVYNRTTDKLLYIVSNLRGRQASSIVNKQLTFNDTTLDDVVTLTTRTSHGLLAGDIVEISGLAEDYLNGAFEVTSVPTSTTFTFNVFPNVATIATVISKKLENNVATITTRTNHGFVQGNSVFVKDVDTVFNGTYVVDSVPTVTSFTYSKNRVPPRTVTGAILVSNIATLTTSEAHSYIEGESVTVSNMSVNYNGTYVISSINSDTSFSYALTRTNNKAITNKQMTADVATITMGADHGFVTNENVTISNLDDTFDGTHRIISTPTATTFTYNVIRATTKTPVVRSRFSNFATITVSDSHGFSVGEQVIVSDVGTGYNVTATITEIPSSTTFTYANSGSNETAISITTGSIIPIKRFVVSRSLIGGVATIQTSSAHGFLTGESVTITNIDSTFNGTYVITSVPSPNSFTYNKTAANVAFAIAGGSIASRGRTGSTAFITTSAAHNLTNGQYVTISNMDSAASVLNGTYIVAVTGTRTFTYTTPTTGDIFSTITFEPADVNTTTNVITKAHTFPTGSRVQAIFNLPAGPSPLVNNSYYFVRNLSATQLTLHTTSDGAVNNTGIVDITSVGTGSGFILSGEGLPAANTVFGGSYATADRTIPSAADSGSAIVSGSLPFAAFSGVSSVSADIVSATGDAIETSGITIKKADIPFTPGIVGATTDFGPDLLEIDTLTRDVALNGSYDGARAKLDVLTDFFFLEPGNNELEFLDTNNSVSEALLKIYYKSGWLG
jgi:hypothetical protein